MKNSGRYIILTLVVVILGFLIFQKLGESGLREKYNQIINNEVNQGNYEEGISQLELLQGQGSEELEGMIRKNLAICYFRMAENPDLPGATTVEYLKKAFSLDPELYEKHKADFPMIEME